MLQNKYHEQEQITFDDIFFVCFTIEEVARFRHLQNYRVLRYLSDDALWHYLSCASVLHSKNPADVRDEWVKKFKIVRGRYDYAANIDSQLDVTIPTTLDMGKVFAQMIQYITENGEGTLLEVFRKVYNSPVTKTINNYNASAYYEPPYVQIRAYYDGHF